MDIPQEKKEVMSKIEQAVQQMEEWATDDSHGYDQEYRWGPNYDCASSTIQAWENAGVPVKTYGATYTGNMRYVFLTCGFMDVTDSVDLATGAGLKRGDVLLNEQNHVAMYCGDGEEVEASINEFGGVTGGQSGDQTGWEFLIRPYRNYPWDCVLRYEAEPEEEDTYMFEFERIQYGDKGKTVKVWQAVLRGRGYIDKKKKGKDKNIDVDGEWGESSQRAWEYFQEVNNFAIVDYCDEARWKKLLWR